MTDTFSLPGWGTFVTAEEDRRKLVSPAGAVTVAPADGGKEEERDEPFVIAAPVHLDGEDVTVTVSDTDDKATFPHQPRKPRPSELKGKKK